MHRNAKPRQIAAILLGLLAALSVSAAAGGEVSHEPLEPPPEIALARVVGDSLKITAAHSRTVSVTSDARPAPGVTWTVTRGTIAGQPATETRIAVETTVSSLRLQHVEARRLDGTLISIAELSAALKTTRPILINRSSNPVASVYRSLFDPRTVVVSVHNPAAPRGGSPTIAPE